LNVDDDEDAAAAAADNGGDDAAEVGGECPICFDDMPATAKFVQSYIRTTTDYSLYL